ncbi:MAG: hypothetical protein HY744_09600 [Deltaproteobacteria bacterium]|nr:hypothetical protein [Deltaproteobacteria bacterium]
MHVLLVHGTCGTGAPELDDELEVELEVLADVLLDVLVDVLLDALVELPLLLDDPLVVSPPPLELHSPPPAPAWPPAPTWPPPEPPGGPPVPNSSEVPQPAARQATRAGSDATTKKRASGVMSGCPPGKAATGQTAGLPTIIARDTAPRTGQARLTRTRVANP